MPTVVRSTPRETNKAKFGPPPPGYWRIVGGAVPGWSPKDALQPQPRGATWELLGPRPIIDEYWSGNDDASGRVVSIAPHPANSNVVYIASASGGIWKTTDAGANWTPISDELPTLNHGAVAVAPSDPNVIYVGTGEYTTRSLGDGMFVSRDAGQTWERAGYATLLGDQCSEIAVDPTDAQRVHLTGSNGYLRTFDGGANWQFQLFGSASDLVLNPDDPNILYVALYGDGIYRSVNGGSSFARLSTGLPTSDIYRIVLAIAPSNPDVLYACYINSSAGLRGFYKSTDGGDTWTNKPNTPNFPYPQGWYDVFVGVDPTNENIVYGGGVFPTYAVGGVVKSTNGGNSWTDITVSAVSGQLHPDMHAIAWSPDGTLWIGNDGGVWKSNDDGVSWINTNATLTVTQNYQISLHPTDPARLMGGTQDNGTIGREYDAIDWPQLLAGDGGFSAYDFNNPTRRYATYVYLTVYRFGTGFDDISGPWGNQPRNFIAPLVMDPQDPDTLLGGTDRIWRTQNASGDADWFEISSSSVSGTGTVNAIAVAPSDSGIIYTGSTSGTLYVTVNDGGNWNARWQGIPSGEISDIQIDPANPAVAYVSVANSSGDRVLRTSDYGRQWTGLTDNLPDGVAATALEVDWRWNPPHLFVGSGAGIYESHDDGQTWIKDGTDLPNVNIGDLRIDYAQGTITAGTYGRGAWRRALGTPNLLGDMNCDGFIDFDDINPFVMALVDPPSYAANYPACDPLRGDLTDDGVLDFDDVNPFVVLMLNLE